MPTSTILYTESQLPMLELSPSRAHYYLYAYPSQHLLHGPGEAQGSTSISEMMNHPQVHRLQPEPASGGLAALARALHSPVSLCLGRQWMQWVAGCIQVVLDLLVFKLKLYTAGISTSTSSIYLQRLYTCTHTAVLLVVRPGNVKLPRSDNLNSTRMPLGLVMGGIHIVQCEMHKLVYTLC